MEGFFTRILEIVHSPLSNFKPLSNSILQTVFFPETWRMEESSDHRNRSKRSPSRTHVSMSDTESTPSQVDSFHSPLPSEINGENNCRSIVLVDSYSSPAPSPEKSNLPASSPSAGGNYRRPEDLDFPADGRRSLHRHMAPESRDFPENRAAAVVGVSKFVREEPPSAVKKVGVGGGRGLEEGLRGGGPEDEVRGERRSRAAVASILKRSERNAVVKKAALGFRVFEAIACLVSFSVMAADRTQGWSGDSFDRYIEYRYCLAVNVIGFVCSGFQAFDLSYHLATGKHVVSYHLRYHFDFTMDQILAYLLMSASSSAATRVDDWISNWGGDEFTLMASSSVAVSFLAFIAFALSALVSGYNLCNRDST